MKKLTLILVAATLLLAACGQNPVASPTLTPTRTLPGPNVTTIAAPDPQVAAKAFLDAWKSEDYPTMYGLLTQLSQDAISEADFEARYKDVAIKMTLKNIDVSLLSALTNPASAQVAYKVVFHTNLLGDITRDNLVMNLVLTKGAWQIQWEDGMILPELRGGNTLSLDLKVPARGNIYDTNGHAIASQADAVALGVVPGEIIASQEDTLLTELSRLTGKNPEAIQALYKYAQPDWYIAVGEASADAVKAEESTLSGLGGLVLSNYRARYYTGIASQAVGYVLSISPEEQEAYLRKGYAGDEKVGASGLEKWGEQYLAGTHGGALYVLDPQGQIVTRLGQSDPQPAQSVYTTLDQDLQTAAEKSLGGFQGSVIVMERDTGRILAMASSPTFDPNLFEPTNRNSELLNQMLSSPDNPLLNRAAQSAFPLGSVFKIVTMSAALQSGLYTPDTVYNCPNEFTELPGVTLYNWTVERDLPADGPLTLSQALMRSCDTYFWHVGLDLFRQNRPLDVSNMARSFGLGSATGIGQISEEAGSMPDPANEGDAVQLAIGQGAMQVTPLQVVDFVAAVGNGGTLYRPQLVNKIETPDGQDTYTFKPEVRGTLPVTPDNLVSVQDAMRSVVANKNGTAYYTFAGMTIPIFGKTGTASTATDPHAWFAGYTNAGRSDKPDIAIVVMCENAGEGSEVAAPIFRRMVEVYFYGQPQRLFPWESHYYVTKTPTSMYTDTPVPPPDTPTPENTPVEGDTPTP